MNQTKGLTWGHMAPEHRRRMFRAYVVAHQPGIVPPESEHPNLYSANVHDAEAAMVSVMTCVSKKLWELQDTGAVSSTTACVGVGATGI